MSEAEREDDTSVSRAHNSDQTHTTTESDGASRLTPPTPAVSDGVQRETPTRISNHEETSQPDPPSASQTHSRESGDTNHADVTDGDSSAKSSTQSQPIDTAKKENKETKMSDGDEAGQTNVESEDKDGNDSPTSSDSFPDSAPLTVQLPDKYDADALKLEPEAHQLEVVIPPPKAQSEVAAAEGAGASDNGDGSNAKTIKETSESVYHIKWINFKAKQVPIVTQNENGPCPLLAIMNVLLLQNRVKLPPQCEFISAGQLMAHLGESVFENVPNPGEGLATPTRLNFEQNMGDAMAVMHKLQTGLDVNVRFTGVREFEYTSECIIFDLLQIALYHGWLVDPQTPQEVEAVGKCTYNQLVEKIIGDKSSDRSEVVSQALIAEQFLESSASQLTYHGLSELASQLKEDELAVLFRNNHFTTLYRTKNELFQLVTDQGFLTESNVVWETLSNVEGDCHFVDSEFRTYTKQELPPVDVSNVPLNTDEQIDQDYLVALSLQQEQQQPSTGTTWVPPGNSQHMSDLELARSLQEEERRAAIEQANQEERRPQQHAGSSRPSPAHSPPRNRSQPRPEYREREEKKSDCCIL